MNIGELAKRSGLTPSRIRFYEASGLIPGVERKDNGYRHYGPDALWMLQLIVGAQSAGFSLDEIRRLLPHDPAQWEHEGLLEGLERKVAEIEQLQKQLEHNKAYLLLAIDKIRNRPDGQSCADHAQWILDRFKEGVPPEPAAPQKR